MERGSYQRDEGRAHQGERRELEREPLYGPGGEPHQRAGRRREDFSEGPAGDHGEGHCAVHPSAIHPLSIQGTSWSYLGHPTPKGNKNHWSGMPSPACEYPYYNIKKEGEHNVQNIRDTAQAAFDSRFLPKRCPNVASPRRVGEPHVQISNGMAYAVLMFRFLPRGDPNATRRRRGQNDLPGIGVP